MQNEVILHLSHHSQDELTYVWQFLQHFVYGFAHKLFKFSNFFFRNNIIQCWCLMTYFTPFSFASLSRFLTFSLESSGTFMYSHINATTSAGLIYIISLFFEIEQHHSNNSNRLKIPDYSHSARNTSFP